jgi:hypothetical protein
MLVLQQAEDSCGFLQRLEFRNTLGGDAQVDRDAGSRSDAA